MNLEELEKQVTRLEDIQEIEYLQRMYGYYFDTARYQEVIDLFSENTESVEITDHGVFRGKEAVKKMYGGMVGMPRPGWMFFEVMQSQGVIEVAPDGRTARGAGTPHRSNAGRSAGRRSRRGSSASTIMSISRKTGNGTSRSCTGT
jgi:hypothetical protein